MLELILDTIHDTWLMLPLLYITYCILEVFERRQSDESDEKIFFALQRIGPFIGALIGLIPQCGFSVLAAMLFLQRNITLGTLVAVMIATSDEAVPILLSNPELYSTLGFLLLAKFIVALIVDIWLISYSAIAKRLFALKIWKKRNTTKRKKPKKHKVLKVDAAVVILIYLYR